MGHHCRLFLTALLGLLFIHCGLTVSVEWEVPLAGTVLVLLGAAVLVAVAKRLLRPVLTVTTSSYPSRPQEEIDLPPGSYREVV